MRHVNVGFVFSAIIVAAFSNAQSPATIPDNLKPSSAEQQAGEVHAEGDQIYACDGSSWVLTGPDAKLLDESGKQIGTHFAGPTWQWSDGSRVVGKAVANATPDPNSIPWLLLTAIDHQGDGFMKQVSSIQRLYTKGGKSPAGGCDESRKGQRTRAHYTAVYRFFARQ